jgi:hypothetical protein
MKFNGMIVCLVGLSFGCTTFALASPQQKSAKDRVAQATENMNRKQVYKLVYKLQKGETVRWTVEHVASTKTRMAGETEETSSRSESTKAWKISSVDSLGNITFVHSIEAVKMWQKIGETDPVAYDSKTDQKVPAEYESVSDKLGKPLAVFSITPNGQITDRKSHVQGARFGTGDVTVPLPKEAIPVGHKWNVPTTFQATDEDGRNQQLKARIAYELIKVKAGNAYISFRTEILTPVESEKVKSQIMQQKTKGYLVFDMSRGRSIRKEIEWDETVQGYEGPDSYLQYLGRMTEKLVDANVQQSSSGAANSLSPLKPKVASQPVQIKTRDGKPVMRK